MEFLEIANKFVKHFEQSVAHTHTKDALKDAILLRDWVATHSKMCDCEDNDEVDIILFCSDCGGRVPESR